MNEDFLEAVKKTSNMYYISEWDIILEEFSAVQKMSPPKNCFMFTFN